MTYTGWFGFDSIPVLTKSDAEVQKYFLTAPDAIAKLWLKRGTSGWRLDVSGDASFPAGYWETFRTALRAWYAGLAQARSTDPSLTSGDFHAPFRR